jgi:phage shock protein PspC (stress-responsive transcriptional regulator)
MNDLRTSGSNSPTGFRLDQANGKLAGVCSGIANYFNMDPLIVRLIFAVGAIAGFGSFIVIYLAVWLLAK